MHTHNEVLVQNAHLDVLMLLHIIITMSPQTTELAFLFAKDPKI